MLRTKESRDVSERRAHLTALMRPPPFPTLTATCSAMACAYACNQASN